MQAATQFDLAKGDVSVEQAFKGLPLEDDRILGIVTNRHEPTNSLFDSTLSLHSSRGAIISTYQASFEENQIGPDLTQQEVFGEANNLVELQPRDRGFGAWSYAMAAFAMYIVVWGFPQAFPIFQTYLATGPEARFPDSTAIRLLAPGLQDMEEGILFPLLPASAKYRKPLILFGIFTISVSLFVASYADSDWQILVTQGITFGIGGIILNFVHVSIFPEWFDKKKGQAMGIIWTGWRVGALGFPVVCQWLLDSHGFEQTVRVLIAPMLSLLVPSILLLRGRYHAATISMRSPRPPVSKRQVLAVPSVFYYLCSTTLFYLVVNVPKMFITTFAADVGMRGSDQAIALVLLNLSDMLSTYLCGYLSDTVYHEGLTAGFAISTALANLLGLGLAKARTGIYLYAVAVGLASGGFTNCLFTYYSETAKGDSELFTAIHSLFSFFRGAAILSIGPVGAHLLRRAPKVELEAFAIARYRSLLIYTCILSLASGLMILAKYIKTKLESRSSTR